MKSIEAAGLGTTFFHFSLPLVHLVRPGFCAARSGQRLASPGQFPECFRSQKVINDGGVPLLPLPIQVGVGDRQPVQRNDDRIEAARCLQQIRAFQRNPVRHDLVLASIGERSAATKTGDCSSVQPTSQRDEQRAELPGLRKTLQPEWAAGRCVQIDQREASASAAVDKHRPPTRTTHDFDRRKKRASGR